MSNELIERVARAINPNAFDPKHSHIENCDECEWYRDIARKQARDAIEAMRKPTDAMIAAIDTIDESEIELVKQNWQAMIDEVLK